MKNLAAILILVLAAGCATVETKKVESGDRTVGDRMVLTLDGAWNHVQAPNMGPAQIWTMEGLPVDQLLVYSGIKEGEAIHAANANAQRKSFQFRQNMQPDEIVSMFEGMLTRDGSTFKLAKLEPYAFGGGKGLRFEYEMLRKVDSVQLSGVGFAAVSNGELFALLYNAPRLEKIARSAKVGLKAP
jgi:hypothetical protein